MTPEVSAEKGKEREKQENVTRCRPCEAKPGPVQTPESPQASLQDLERDHWAPACGSQSSKGSVGALTKGLDFLLISRQGHYLDLSLYHETLCRLLSSALTGLFNEWVQGICGAPAVYEVPALCRTRCPSVLPLQGADYLKGLKCSSQAQDGGTADVCWVGNPSCFSLFIALQCSDHRATSICLNRVHVWDLCRADLEGLGLWKNGWRV